MDDALYRTDAYRAMQHAYGERVQRVERSEGYGIRADMCPEALLQEKPADMKAMLAVLIEAERCAIRTYTEI